MIWHVAGVVSMTFSLTAYAGSFDKFSPDRIGHPVLPHPNREGLYLISYRYKHLLEEYGTGWAETLAQVRQSHSNVEIQRIWDHALTTAVQKYMKDNDLVPSECRNGIVIISNSMDEGGGGATAFRCHEIEGTS